MNFITGAGGFLQSVLYGYSGLRVRADRLDLTPPPLPAGTDSIRLQGVNYQGNRLSVLVEADTLTVGVLSAGATALQLRNVASGSVAKLSAGSPAKVPRAGAYAIEIVKGSDTLVLGGVVLKKPFTLTS